MQDMYMKTELFTNTLAPKFFIELIDWRRNLKYPSPRSRKSNAKNLYRKSGTLSIGNEKWADVVEEFEKKHRQVTSHRVNLKNKDPSHSCVLAFVISWFQHVDWLASSLLVPIASLHLHVPRVYFTTKIVF